MVSVCQDIPASPLPLVIKNTFFDLEDDALEVDPRRSSSEPPSCRHRDQDRELPSGFGLKRSDSRTELSESTASGCGSPRGSTSDATSDDGTQQVTTPSPTIQSNLNPNACVWGPAWRPTLFPGNAAPCMTPKPCLSLPVLSLELSVLAMIPRCFQGEFQELFKAAELSLSKGSFIEGASIVEGQGLWGMGMKIVGSLSEKVSQNKKDKLLTSVQEALLQKAEESESVYVMGYALRPFTQTQTGFAAMLGGLKDDGWACWDTLTKGFCSREGQCRRSHPACMIPIYVEISEQQPAK